MENGRKTIFLAKRFAAMTLAACLVLALAVPGGYAEERKDYYGLYQAAREAGDAARMAEIRAEMPERLHPAKDNETRLWGYINFLGEWVIPPQYETAGLFRGNYAAVSTGDPWDYTMGIIDRAGSWVVEARYFVDEGYDGWTYGGLNRGMYLVWENSENDAEERYRGYFDVRSGHLSQQSTGEWTWWSDAELVPLDDYDEETGEDIAVYIRRSTGEEVIRLKGYETDWLMNTSEFHNGFAMIYREDEDRPCIINEQGEILDIPDTLAFYDSDVGMTGEQYYAFGVLVCRDAETGLFGYWDLNAMDWRVTPQYQWADQFSLNGCACVQLPDGTFGHIDPQGKALAGGFSEEYRFLGDYAYLEAENILIDAAGETALAFPEGWELQVQWDDELNDEYDYYVSPDGLLAVTVEGVGAGVMNLDGDWILPPEDHYVYTGDGLFDIEGWRFFSEGLQAVARRGDITGYRTVKNVYTGTYEEPIYDWKVGYINPQGQVIVDYRYDRGGAFLGGLAEVSRDGMSGYIDAFGREIFFWRDE